MEAIAEPPAQAQHLYPIHAGNAAELAKRRWEKARAAKDATLMHENAVKEAVSKALAEARLQPREMVEQAREEQEKELENAREQVALLSKRLTSALEDPKTPPVDVERLQRSLSSAREDERKLAGRSLPPTVKAAQVKPASRRGTFVDPT